MKKIYKHMLFDIELAKKIQSREIKGKIVTQYNEPVRIVCFDKKSTNKRETYQVVALVEINGRECSIICGEKGLCWDCEEGCNRSLHIELLEALDYEFKPFDRVLVRNIDSSWIPKLFASECFLNTGYEKGYMTTDEKRWLYCIPYEGNEHLVGTTNSPKED